MCKFAGHIFTRTTLTPRRWFAACVIFPDWSTRASSNRSANPLSTSTSIARARKYVGISESDVTNSMVVNLAGSSQVQPTFWLNPENGVNYCDRHADAAISGRLAQRACSNLPITSSGSPNAQPQDARSDCRLQALARIPAVYSQYNVQPLVQIYGTTQGRDLGAVAADVQKVLDETAKDAPKTAQVAHARPSARP